MENEFNANFFFASATVIPVLFLAFAVQGNLLARFRKNMKELRKADKRPSVKRPAIILTTGLGITAALIYGVGGEIVAFHALRYQNATIAEQNFVYASVIVLVVLVAASPIYLLFLAPLIRMLVDAGIRRSEAELQKLVSDEGTNKKPGGDKSPG